MAGYRPGVSAYFMADHQSVAISIFGKKVKYLDIKKNWYQHSI